MSKKRSPKERRKRLAFSRGPVICPLCNQLIKNHKEANWDHIVAKSNGGPNMWENLQLTHRICNQKRGNQSLDHETTLAAKKAMVLAIINGKPSRSF